MKTLLPNKDYKLEDNEIYVYNIIPIISGEGETLTKKVLTHSTAPLQGVKQLDRSMFVKGVDVKELANSANGYNLYFKETKSPIFNEGFIAGYNANKNEFSKSDMEKMFYQGALFKDERPYYDMSESKASPEYIDWFIKTLRPLSLPASITLNGDDITIKW